MGGAGAGAGGNESAWFRRCIEVLFFLSGLSALIYQVTWMRYLSLFFGSDIYAAAITLASFMCGLSLGSYLAHRLARSTRRPLVVYAFLEIAIGIYALFFVGILGLFHGLFSGLYLSFVEAAPAFYNLVRFLVAGSILILPTVLMGASLPLIVERFSTPHAGVGDLSGRFYAYNTAGAIAGSIAGGFWLFPAYGFRMTTIIAAALNGAIGLVAVLIDRRSPKVTVKSALANPIESKAGKAPGEASPLVRHATLVTIAVSGCAAMAFEVVIIRWLTLSFSATVYSFALMLVCFLFGIAYGSSKASRMADESAEPARSLGLFEIGIACSVFLLSLLSPFVPALFGSVLWNIVGLTGGSFAVASIMAMTLIAFLVLVVPTTLLGMTFPYAVKVWTRETAGLGHGTGGIYAANTLGAVVGALIGGFLLVPLLGLRGAILAVAVIFMIAGWVQLLCVQRMSLKALAGPVFASAFGLAAIAVDAARPLQVIANYYIQQSENPKVVYYGEGAAHAVAVLESKSGNTIMMVDGNVEADTTYVQRRHFILKGHLPLLLQRDPDSALVIGLGLGVTLGATLRNPELSHVQVVELTPEMVAAQSYLKQINGDVLSNTKLSLRVDDARNYLTFEPKTFDMITADPIHPRISGVGYLYTTEYYESLKRHLNHGGIVCQWMPMYNISPQSFAVAFKTFAKIFPNATFWYVRGHGLFVAKATDGPIDYATVSRAFENAVVKQDLASIGINTPSDLFAHMMMGPKEIASFVQDHPDLPENTDDNAWLEHRVPFEFLGTTRDILTQLIPYMNFDSRNLENAQSSDLAAIKARWDSRKARLIEELSDPIE